MQDTANDDMAVAIDSLLIHLLVTNVISLQVQVSARNEEACNTSFFSNDPPQPALQGIDVQHIEKGLQGLSFPSDASFTAPNFDLVSQKTKAMFAASSSVLFFFCNFEFHSIIKPFIIMFVIYMAESGIVINITTHF